MVRTQIYLPYDQITNLRRRAAEEGVSLSEIIRRLVSDFDGKKKNQKNVGRVLLEMAQDAERRKVKGPKDLASNLDKYLYG